MKKTSKVLLSVLLIISLAFNGLMCYYFYNISVPSPSVIKFGFDEHNIEVYCEKAQDVEAVKLNSDVESFKIGNAELVNGEQLYLVYPAGEINLSQTGSTAFVINSDGKLLYQLAEPQDEPSPAVFVTPGEKNITVMPFVQVELPLNYLWKRLCFLKESLVNCVLNKQKNSRYRFTVKIPALYFLYKLYLPQRGSACLDSSFG